MHHNRSVLHRNCGTVYRYCCIMHRNGHAPPFCITFAALCFEIAALCIEIPRPPRQPTVPTLAQARWPALRRTVGPKASCQGSAYRRLLWKPVTLFSSSINLCHQCSPMFIDPIARCPLRGRRARAQCPRASARAAPPAQVRPRSSARAAPPAQVRLRSSAGAAPPAQHRRRRHLRYIYCNITSFI